MASVMTYSAVASKLRAMYSRILTSEDYEVLMSKPRVADVFLWLKDNSAYGESLTGLNEASVHRGQMERAFSKSLYQDSYKLSLMLPEKDGKMLECILAKTDIQIVKRVIRSIHTGIPIDLGTVKSIYKNQNFGMHFDLQRTLMAKTYEELGEVLRHTPLHHVIDPFLQQGIKETFELENALDQYYFTLLNTCADQYLKGEDRKKTKEFLATEVDIHNLLRSYRYKKYYNYSGEKMLVHLFPNHHKLRPSFWRKAAERDPKDFRELVGETQYRKLFQGEDDGDWYREADQLLADGFRKYLRKEPYHFPAVMAYIFLKERDIQNLITIIEGVRYSLDPQEIRKYLVTIK